MITPRLNMILQNISGDRIADIGTDHAYIPIELAKLGKSVIATDISEGPLKNAKKNTENFGFQISLRLGGGLKPIKSGEVDEIIIAGMGGEMIKKIISEDYQNGFSARLLLQPMNSQAELRKFLLENGFRIVGEDLAREGFKIYNLIICEKGEEDLPTDEIYLHLPKSLRNHSLFPMLAEKKKREFSKQLNGLKKGKNIDEAEISRLQRLLTETEKIIKEV